MLVSSPHLPESSTPPSGFDLALLERAAAPAGSELPPPRLLVVFAHADDEVIALGARLERLHQSSLLTVTDGAPMDGADAHHHGFSSLEAYRATRSAELLAALTHAGLPASVILHPGLALAPLPVPDQAASLHLAELVLPLTSVIEDLRPDAILTHPYEGGHPDHDACAFAVHTAVRRLQVSGRPAPVIMEAPFYHAGPNGSMQTGVFLQEAPHTRTRQLSAAETRRKQERLACFASQAETLAQFGCDQETIRLAPAYDFSEPPHPGQLFYEQFPWGMTGARFRALALLALAGIAETPHGTTEVQTNEAASASRA